MTRSTRRRERQGADAREALAFTQREFEIIRNPWPPMDMVPPEALESLHNTSMTILEDIGMDVLDEEARDFFQKAGGKVEGERVRLDRDLIMESLKTCPGEFTMHASNPAHNIRIGGNYMTFGQVSSPPNCSDIKDGRRPGNIEDFRKFLKLTQSLNVIHFVGGYPVEPIDWDPAVRHLHAGRDMAFLTDKVGHGYSLGDARIKDSMTICRLARGVSEAEFANQPSMFTVINTSSPLRLDKPMANGIINMSGMGQAVILTPFTLSGAMAPVTIAGALAQQNAECLFGICLTQLVRPGAPVIYGGFTSNVDMKTGSPAFGTPEYAQAVIIGGQLARHYGLPYRTSNVNASNCVDAQAAWESETSLWAVMLGGGNLIKHSAGWLEGGLCASFEKMIIDADLLQMKIAFMTPPVMDEAALALEAVRDVGPAGHFFGTAHTMERYRNAFHAPNVSDWNNFENWEGSGSKTATERAHEIYLQLLDEYEQPSIDPAIREAINDFVDRRVSEGGAPDY